MKNKKKFKFLFLVLLLSLTTSLFSLNIASAHTTTCNSGSESVGWIVNCTTPAGHAGTSSYTYKFDAGLETKYKTYTGNGVARWNNTSIVNITFSSISANLVTSHSGPDSDTVAVTRSWKNSVTGHKTKWELSYNRYIMGNYGDTQNNGTATHEIGHTIGLVDLYNTSNQNKLMYGIANRTVYSPTSYDQTGAKEAVK